MKDRNGMIVGLEMQMRKEMRKLEVEGEVDGIVLVEKEWEIVSWEENVQNASLGRGAFGFGERKRGSDCGGWRG